MKKNKRSNYTHTKVIPGEHKQLLALWMQKGILGALKLVAFVRFTRRFVRHVEAHCPSIIAVQRREGRGRNVYYMLRTIERRESL